MKNVWKMISKEDASYNIVYNFVNDKGEYLSKQWYDNAEEFYEGYAAVLDEKAGWNFIDEEGSLISDIWFDDVNNFSEGLAAVCMYDAGWNFITPDGQYKFDHWYDDVYDFYNGYAKVHEVKMGWNLINKEGLLVSGKWYDWVEYFNDGFAKIKYNEKYNLMNASGEPVYDHWFEDESMTEVATEEEETETDDIHDLPAIVYTKIWRVNNDYVIADTLNDAINIFKEKYDYPHNDITKIEMIGRAFMNR